MDDWRGEYLIRKLKKHTGRPATPDSTYRKKKRTARRALNELVPPICATPRCHEELAPRTRSGVCRKHNHNEFCKCKKCCFKRGEVEVVK